MIEVGSIGWEDEDEYVFFGEAGNDGHTLIRVQLFRDRDVTKDLNPTRAQGKKVICHLSGGFFRVPPKDTRCYVIFPEDMAHMPASGVVVATIEKSPTTQFAKDRAVLDFGSDVHVIIKGKSISLQDPEFRFVSVGTPRAGGTPGVQVHLPDGTGAAWQENAYACFCQAGLIMQMTNSSFEVWESSGTFLKMGSGKFWTYGATNMVQGAGVFLGKLPTSLNFALWGPTGIGGIASPSVYISPV